MIRPKGSNDDAKTVAAKPRKPSATTTAAARASSEFAAENLRGNSSIKQTAGNRPLPSIAKNMTVESKRRATEQSSPTFEVADAGAAIASNHERRRADRLMERAHERYRSGYPEEALRLASVAVELEKSGQAVYRLGDERPSNYITWLQSTTSTGSMNPPVIKPQLTLNQPSPNSRTSGSAIAVARADTSDRRRRTDIISANTGPGSPLSAETAADAPISARSNSGIDLATPEAPRFTSDNQSTWRAGANSGQVEVPIPPQPRSADARLATTNGGGPSLDSPAVPEASPPVVNRDRFQDQMAQAPAAPAEFDRTAGAPPTSVAMADDAQPEHDSFAESETPGVVPAQTTQLTIASLVGLVTGIAGMFGLSWWRHQERRHYAAGK